MINNNYDNLYKYFIQNLSIFREISQDITCLEPINHFAYQRLYIGGKHLIFFTNLSYSQHFFNTVFDLGEDFKKIIQKSEINKINYHLWPIIPNTSYYEGMFNHKMWNGFTIYVRKNDFIDVYYFATSNIILDYTEMANFYLNKIDLLKSYIKNFNNKADSIINVRDSKILGNHTGQFILEEFEEVNLYNFSKNIQRYYWNINGNNIYFTSQELKCLEFLSKGYSTKFIAKYLGLSPRTVESYLQMVKYKTGLKNKDLLLEWFNEKTNRRYY